MKFRNSAYFLLIFASLAVTGCARIGQLKSAPDSGGGSGVEIVREAVASGAAACRYNLEDMLIHTLGDRKLDGFINYPLGDIERRPFSGTYITTYKNGDKASLHIIAGKDASGFCTLFWSETRFWNHSCDQVAALYTKEDKFERSRLGSTTVLSGDKKISVLLNPMSSSTCLVVESDSAWRINPDDDARKWIHTDHGYYPDE